MILWRWFLPPSLCIVPSWSLCSRVGEPGLWEQAGRGQWEAQSTGLISGEPLSRCVFRRDFSIVKEVLPSKRNSLKNCRVLGNKCYKKWVEREGVIEKRTFWKWLSTRKVLQSEEWMFWICLRVQKRVLSETNVDEKINLLLGFAIAVLWLKRNSSETQDKKKRVMQNLLGCSFVLLFTSRPLWKWSVLYKYTCHVSD